MNQKPMPPADIERMQFDEFGRYEVTELVGDGELDLVSGGDSTNAVCPNLPGCNPNVYCPAPAPPPPPPNKTCGEDGDEE